MDGYPAMHICCYDDPNIMKIKPFSYLSAMMASKMFKYCVVNVPKTLINIHLDFL